MTSAWVYPASSDMCRTRNGYAKMGWNIFVAVFLSQYYKVVTEHTSGEVNTWVEGR